MQKIGASTASANALGEFTEGNPGAGVAATLLKAAWLNAVQRELVHLVEGAGLVLNAADDSQVLKAIQAIQANANTWLKLNGKPTTIAGFGITDAFTKAETTSTIQQRIADLVASSPAALDTLKELADALGNDPNFATTMTNALAGKAEKASTLAGYGIKDGMQINTGGLGTTAPIVQGAVSDVTDSRFISMSRGQTDDTPSGAGYLAGIHVKYPDRKHALDIAGAVNAEWLGFRNVSFDGTGRWLEIWHAGNFNPALYLPTAALPRSTSGDGWWRCGDTGVMRQWMRIPVGDINNNALRTAVWAIQFPHACLSVTATLESAGGVGGALSCQYAVKSRDVAGAVFRFWEWASEVQSYDLWLNIEAVGY